MTITLVSILTLLGWLLIGALVWWAIAYVLGLAGVPVSGRVFQVVAALISILILISWLTGGLPGIHVSTG